MAVWFNRLMGMFHLIHLLLAHSPNTCTHSHFIIKLCIRDTHIWKRLYMICVDVCDGKQRQDVGSLGEVKEPTTRSSKGENVVLSGSSFPHLNTFVHDIISSSRLFYATLFRYKLQSKWSEEHEFECHGMDVQCGGGVLVEKWHKNATFNIFFPHYTLWRVQWGNHKRYCVWRIVIDVTLSHFALSLAIRHHVWVTGFFRNDFMWFFVPQCFAWFERTSKRLLSFCLPFVHFSFGMKKSTSRIYAIQLLVWVTV